MPNASAAAALKHKAAKERAHLVTSKCVGLNLQQHSKHPAEPTYAILICKLIVHQSFIIFGVGARLRVCWGSVDGRRADFSPRLSSSSWHLAIFGGRPSALVRTLEVLPRRYRGKQLRMLQLFLSLLNGESQGFFDVSSDRSPRWAGRYRWYVRG